MIYFVRTRHVYEPYVDYYNLAGLSGFVTIFDDQLEQHDAPDTVFIMTWFSIAHLHNTGEAVRVQGRVIIWQLEWDMTRPNVAGAEVWVSNKTYADKIGARYVLLGSHPSLAPQTNGYEKQFDAIHLSYAVPRRAAVYDEFIALGGTIAPNAWGLQRHILLAQSRIMLYVAQHETFPAIAPLRLALCAAYRLPMVSEKGWDVDPIPASQLFAVDYSALASVAYVITRPEYYAGLAKVGEWLHDYLCIENNFRKSIEDAL